MAFFEENDEDVFMNANVNKKKNLRKTYMVLAVAVLAVGILLVSVTAGKKTAPQAADTAILETQEEKVTEEPVVSKFEMCEYKGESYSLDVPAEWVEVKEDGKISFVPKETSASLQIKKMDYAPSLNLASENLFRESLSSIGYEFCSFSRTTPSSYELSYENNKTFFVEFTFYDRETAYTLYCTVPIEYKETFLPTYILAAQSFEYEQTSPIVDGFSIYYAQSLGYEIGYPTDWSVSYENNVFSAVDTELGSTMVVTAAATTEQDLSSVTQIGYNEIITQNKQNYQMFSFFNDGNYLNSQGVYIDSNNEKVRIIQSMIMATGGYYIITFECKEDYAATASNVYDTIIEMFRMV